MARKKLKIGVYAGSFDPPTKGHEYVITEGAKLFDGLIVAVAVNPAKSPMFSADERVAMIEKVAADRKLKNVSAVSFPDNELTVEMAREYGAFALLRGLRTGDDFEKERSMFRINRKIDSSIQTVLLIAPAELAEVSSSDIKGLAMTRTGLRHAYMFLPESVWVAVADRIGYRRFSDWYALWRRLGCKKKGYRLLEAYQDLVAHYAGEKDQFRAYHNMVHVFRMLDTLQPYRELMDHPDWVEAAAWFHDVIYRVGSQANEALSAQYAAQVMSELVPNLFKGQHWVTMAIEASVHNGRYSVDRDGALFLDADLMTLGVPLKEYLAIRELIRQENSAASDEQFAVGSLAFSQSMLGRKQLFLSPEFHELYEEQARKNLQRTVEIATKQMADIAKSG